jgi:hypothetical protein
MPPIKLYATIVLFLVALAAQDEGNTRLRDSLRDQVSGDWFYDDLPAGLEAAKKESKPLLVLFRCVP